MLPCVGKSFQKEFLDAVNSYRAKHHAPPLTLNGEMNAAAQKWADRLLEKGSLEQSGTKDGESTYYMYSSDSFVPTGREAVDRWYSGIEDYDFTKPGYQNKTGNFTQLVWRDSKELGVGVACDGTKAFVVGHYRPAGNFTNEGCFQGNVLPKGLNLKRKLTKANGAGFEGETETIMTCSPDWPMAQEPSSGHGHLRASESQTKNGESNRNTGLSQTSIHPSALSSSFRGTLSLSSWPWVCSEAPSQQNQSRKPSPGRKASCPAAHCTSAAALHYTSYQMLPFPFASESSFVDKSFRKEFLDAVNSYRAKHHAPPLTLNGEMNAAAQKWADRLLEKGSLEQSGTKDGESTYYMYSSDSFVPTGKEAVDHWYEKIEEYNFSKPGYQHKSGNFTQLVWRDSQRLGVGMACDGTKAFVVGHYRPAGNVLATELFQKNVLAKGWSLLENDG
ncbi:uncharacterized protein [Leuresthes tenuis]|uniref:uncharacterized protein n=1 Tax=Leuresthes tenuis TaxID=355514 RepID=UPI003B514776